MIQTCVFSRKCSILGACLAAVLLLGAVDSAAQYLGPGDFEYPLIEFDARISYGADDLQYADLRLPDGDGPHPVIVLLHGGCWQGLHRPRHVERLAVALTDAGWATWNLSHRQAPDAGGGWTGTFEDVSNGIDRLRKVAQKYELDLDAVVTMGHSAGGHLAIWAGARSRVPEGSEIHFEDPLPLAGAISLGGIPDLRAHYNQEVNPCGKGVTDLMGGKPSAVPERYAHASPAELLPTGTKQLILHGVDDYVVPVSLVEAYAGQANAAGDDVQLAVIPDASHFEMIAPSSVAWQERVKPVLMQFLDEVRK